MLASANKDRLNPKKVSKNLRDGAGSILQQYMRALWDNRLSFFRTNVLYEE